MRKRKNKFKAALVYTLALTMAFFSQTAVAYADAVPSETDPVHGVEKVEAIEEVEAIETTQSDDTAIPDQENPEIDVESVEDTAEVLTDTIEITNEANFSETEIIDSQSTSEDIPVEEAQDQADNSVEVELTEVTQIEVQSIEDMHIEEPTTLNPSTEDASIAQAGEETLEASEEGLVKGEDLEKTDVVVAEDSPQEASKDVLVEKSEDVFEEELEKEHKESESIVEGVDRDNIEDSIEVDESTEKVEDDTVENPDQSADPAIEAEDESQENAEEAVAAPEETQDGLEDNTNITESIIDETSEPVLEETVESITGDILEVVEEVPVVFEEITVLQAEKPIVYVKDFSNAIGGIDETMEFRIGTGDWEKYDGVQPDLRGRVEVEVRVAATGVLEASESVVLTFTDNAPKVTLNLESGLFENLSTDMEYQINDREWIVCPEDGNVDLTDALAIVFRYTEDAIERFESELE